MSFLPAFVLHRPSTLAEALEIISPDDMPYVGGTELLLAMRQGLLRPRSLVDLKGIPELGEIEVGPEWVTLGGTVTHGRAARHPGVAQAFPVLPRVLRRVGNPRVQAMGTLAGNLCFAEPKSDVIPLLAALEAEIVLVSEEGTRTVTIDELVIGPYATSRRPQELVRSIRIPRVEGRRATYLKYQIMERPTVGVAAVVTPGSEGTTLRVAVGAAGLLPVVVESDSGTVEAEDVAARIEPMDDLTGSSDYKRHVTAVYVRRALEQLEAMP